jgi:class 3 adenylate cyclase
VNIAETQMLKTYRDVIEAQLSIFDEGRTVTKKNAIPDTSDIPLDDQTQWITIPDVICVYVDMMGSTKLSADTREKQTAGAYQLYTGTAVRLFHAFEAPYIDVRGDGAFALFDGTTPYRALAAAVTFKTFARLEFVPRIRQLTGSDVGSHIGIDQKTLLVRRIGLRSIKGRTDRQNEVWAGRPVNMAAKLASITANDELLASHRYFTKLKDERALMSCGCPDGEKSDLWTDKDLSDDARFDFSKGHILKSAWCKEHGREYCEGILHLED